MAENAVNFSRFTSFDLPAGEVWNALIRFDDMDLYRWDTHKIRLSNGGTFSGSVSVRGIPFRLNASPYDIRINSQNVRMGIRIKPTGAGCSVIVACASPDGSGGISESDVESFLARLRTVLHADPEPSAEVSAEGSAEPAPVGKKTVSAGKTKKRQKSHEGKASAFASAALYVLLLILFAAGIVTSFIGAGDRRSDSELPLISARYKTSDKVTLDEALSLEPGATRSSVESSLGKGTGDSKACVLYLSSDTTEYGTPSVAVQVIYDGNSAAAINVLDLEHSSRIGSVTGDHLSPSSSLAELEQQAGAKVSLIRSYTENGITYREYHFGYMDPLFNFSPSWEGELWARTGSDGSFISGRGYRYDGADPLFHSDPAKIAAAQYDSFDEYMNDFRGYRFCLGFRDQPDRYAAVSLIPDLEISEHIDETSLYNGSSSSLLDDGSPVWSYTAGFGTRGDMVLFSAVNRRLWKKDNQLTGTDYSDVRSGMSFYEALGCMDILPSMIYIDHSYITMGFGQILPDTDILTEQFEFCIRFSLTDDVVESIYDNTGTQLVID